MAAPQVDYLSVTLPAAPFWPNNGQRSAVAPFTWPAAGGPSVSI